MRHPSRKSYGGISMTTKEWAQSIGIKVKTLEKRVRKMGIDRAITYQIQKRVDRARKAMDEVDNVKILEQIANEKQKREEEEWRDRVDDAVHAVQLSMLARGYFRKGRMIWRYKMLNAWYKEFRAEDMKAD